MNIFGKKHIFAACEKTETAMNIVDRTGRTLFLAAIVSAAWLAVSCGKDENFGIRTEPGVEAWQPGTRQPFVETRRVLLFYECGFNSLHTYISSDMNAELTQGYIPKEGRNAPVLLVYSKLAENDSYKPVKSYLRRLHLDADGRTVSDTLKTFDEQVVASDPQTMKQVLHFVKEKYPAASYGMVFSSHGSGWLPNGYYNNPSAYEKAHGRSAGIRRSPAGRSAGIPSGNMETDDPYLNMVRSLGQDILSGGNREMSVAEFVEGIPFRLDYLLFDMCFSGGLEVVYGLKDAAGHLGVSPAEVLAEGMFDYTRITTFLLKGAEPDLEGLFKHSFERYDSQTGPYRSATVNLVRTDGLERLAAVCRTLFEKYRSALQNAPVAEIQGYFRLGRHYFYDIEDTFVQCGASPEELSALKAALDGCVVYKAATPSFLDTFDIRTYSGFSIYLPCNGTDLLNTRYLQEPWNLATGCIR